MKKYIYKTTVKEALNNFEIRFVSNLNPLDVLTLINKHNKYEFSLACDNNFKGPCVALSEALAEIDERKLLRYKTILTSTEKVIRETTFGANSCKLVTYNNTVYYEIDFSMDEYKVLKEDSYKVKCEIAAIHSLVDFLGFYDVVYGDSRAKLRIPKYNHEYLVYITEKKDLHGLVYDKTFTIKLKEIHLLEHKDVVEVEPINK